IVSPGSATATCRPNSLRCFRFKRPLSNRSKVDILRFAMAYSSSLKSDPGSARLAKKLQTLQRGRAGAFSRHWPSTNQYIAAAEVMLLNGHKAPTVHRPLLAARVLSRLKARGRRKFKFLAQYIAHQGTRLLLTACIVFGVASGEPIFRYGKRSQAHPSPHLVPLGRRRSAAPSAR